MPGSPGRTTAAAGSPADDPTTLDFTLVDVFSDVPPAGNPVAVVQDADGLSVETMRRIAREFNRSESTGATHLMVPARDRGYAMGRPSVITVRTGGPAVQIAGRAVAAATGWLRIAFPQ